MKIFLSVFLLLISTACATAHLGRDASGVAQATLTGDPQISAGLPITVALRKVDDAEIRTFYSHVSVSPGMHRVIVDCRVASSKSSTRFALDVDALAGTHYRLIAQLAPGNQYCDAVRIETR